MKYALIIALALFGFSGFSQTTLTTAGNQFDGYRAAIVFDGKSQNGQTYRLIFAQNQDESNFTKYSLENWGLQIPDAQNIADKDEYVVKFAFDDNDASYCENLYLATKSDSEISNQAIFYLGTIYRCTNDPETEEYCRFANGFFSGLSKSKMLKMQLKYYIY